MHRAALGDLKQTRSLFLGELAGHFQEPLDANLEQPACQPPRHEAEHSRLLGIAPCGRRVWSGRVGKNDGLDALGIPVQKALRDHPSPGCAKKNNRPDPRFIKQALAAPTDAVHGVERGKGWHDHPILALERLDHSIEACRIAGKAVNPVPYMVESEAQRAFALATGTGGQGDGDDN